MGPQPDAWSVSYRVRFDEAGPDGRLRTSGLLRYAQDVAWYHSAARGFDRDWYAARGLSWLVRTADLTVLAPIPVRADLVVTTRVAGWRRVWARRRTDFEDPDGQLLAWGWIDWVLLDARGAPTRIPAEFEPVFGGSGGALALARVDLGEPPEDARMAELVVRPHELDPMGHVNNAVYADWLEEAVGAAGDRGVVATIPRRLRLEYAGAAAPGARLLAAAWRSGDGWAYRLRDLAGTDLLRGRLEPRPADREA
jgi:acyl-ACP thioesterase